MQYRVARISETPDFHKAATLSELSEQPRFSCCDQALNNCFETFEKAMRFCDHLNGFGSHREWRVYSIECIGRNATSGELIWDLPRLA